jgi:site-specific DNA recombinase
MKKHQYKKNGIKHRMEYYCCGVWKNKGTAVCRSNSIRVNDANEYVFNKLSELLNNDKLIKDIVANINSIRKAMVGSVKRRARKNFEGAGKG